jgi:hypothetical protein
MYTASGTLVLSMSFWNCSTRPLERAATAVRAFVGRDRKPDFWCHYGAYDWYWFCRLFGGFMQMPPHWPHRFEEFACLQQEVTAVAGAEHNALNDAKSLMQALKTRKPA